MRQRLHIYGNRISRDDRNFIKVGQHKICRYLPENNSLQFQVRETSNGMYINRLIEIEKNEFLQRLTEVLT